MTDILGRIDGAIEAWECGPDAARWTADERELPGLAHLREVAEQLAAERAEAIRRAGVALQAGVAALTAGLAPAFAQMKLAFESFASPLQRQAGRSDETRRMHSMYAQRVRARRRRH